MSNLFPSLSVLTNSRKLQERLFFCLFSSHKEAYCSVTKLCLTLYDPMDCSMSGLSVLHHLPKFARTQVYLVSDAIQPSYPLSSLSPLALCLSQHQSFPVSQLFVLGSQSIGASASELPMNIHVCFPLELTNLISCCPRDSQESSPELQFQSIHSSVLSLLYCPTLTSI